MSTVLFFYPENPLSFTQGNNIRAHTLLKYFMERNISVDFIGESSSYFKQKDISILKEKSLIQNGWLLNKQKKSIHYYLKFWLPQKIKKIFQSKNEIVASKEFDRRKYGHQEQFDAILSKNSYEFIIISYAYWAPLLMHTKFQKNAKTIIDTHDFLSAQFQQIKHYSLKKIIEREVNSLNYFDIVWSISVEEHFLFSQFLPKKEIQIIPHGTSENFQNTEMEKEIDLIYVASDNTHNRTAANWFFSNVHPLLPDTLKITVIGKISNAIPDKKNITKKQFVSDLSETYKNSKIAICPMLSGTGLKIKIVEALSYGIPVVCNTRGVDGLLNKTQNGCSVTDSPKEFASYILQLLKDEKFYNEQTEAAKSFFSLTLDKEEVYKSLDRVFK